MKTFARLAGVATMAASCCAIAGARAEEQVRYIDLEPKANLMLGDSLGSGIEGNNLAELPTGEQTLGGVKFKIGPGLIHLGSKLLPSLPEKVEGIAVDGKINKLHILHATCYGRGPEDARWYVKSGTLIGEYVVQYDDKSAEGIPIVYGEDVCDWFFGADDPEPSRGKVAWKGDNGFAGQVNCRVRLYVSTWTNPKPDKKVVRIDFISRKEESRAAPFCVSMSVEAK